MIINVLHEHTTFQKFLDFKQQCQDLDYDNMYNFLRIAPLDSIHHINISELNDGDCLFVYPMGLGEFTHISWEDFEIWKVYKTENVFHFLEFDNTQKSLSMLQSMLNQTKMDTNNSNLEDLFKSHNINIHNVSSYKTSYKNCLYKFYKYYDASINNEEFLYRGDSEVIGLKIKSVF